MQSRQIAGILYLAYGVFKSLFDLAILTRFTKAHEDETLSGRMYHYVFLLFSIYTMVLGLSLLHVLPAKFRAVVERKWTEYTVMIVLGAFLIIFYSLALYSNVRVDKKKENQRYYELFGIGAGIWFVLTPIILETLSLFVPIFHGWTIEYRAMTILAISLVAAVSFDAFYTYLRRNKMDDVLPPVATSLAQELRMNSASSRKDDSSIVSS